MEPRPPPTASIQPPQRYEIGRSACLPRAPEDAGAGLESMPVRCHDLSEQGIVSGVLDMSGKLRWPLAFGAMTLQFLLIVTQKSDNEKLERQIKSDGDAYSSIIMSWQKAFNKMEEVNNRNIAIAKECMEKSARVK